VPHVLSLLVPLATSPSPSPSPDVPNADLVSPGWLGFVFLLFLAFGVFVIWKSMNTQLTRVTFDEDVVNSAAAPATDAPVGDAPAGDVPVGGEPPVETREPGEPTA
jgi:hypothetical protein